jgi:hypothetical protein
MLRIAALVDDVFALVCAIVVDAPLEDAAHAPSQQPGDAIGMQGSAAVVRGLTAAHGSDAFAAAAVSGPRAVAALRVARLTRTVDTLLAAMRAYMESYNALVRRHVASVVASSRMVEEQGGEGVATTGGAAQVAAHALVATPATAVSGQALSGAAASSGTAGRPAGRSAPTSPAFPGLADRLVLSDLDSLCFHSAAYAVGELADAAVHMARTARRIHQANSDAW